MSDLDSVFRSSSVHKIIVGVDYGTTYSGVSYVQSSKNSIDDVNVLVNWPDYRYNEWKAPTKIAYAHENKGKISQNTWGYSVHSGHQSYTWTKLLLDKNVELTEFDDPLLRDLYGNGLLKLPRNKTAQDVCEDFLRELYKFTVHKLEKELSPEVFRRTPLEIWLTMPAIWSDQAQAATRDAAKAAGFGSRAGDTLNMITEPEAAAIAAMKPHLGLAALDPMQSGEVIMVCDCGGGTVDIATYSITSTTPTLKYDEPCIGMGGKCGSTAIDRNFNQWMSRNFGDSFTSLSLTKRGPGSKFMQSFEFAKKNFRASGEDKTFEIGPLNLELPWSPIYDDDEMAVKLTKKEMEGLFRPVVKDLIRLVDTQASLAKEKKGRSVDRFILVGGFGDSDYLNDKLKRWCKSNGVKRFTCPRDPQAAIVKGAALRGLEGTQPTIKIAKRHYGWSWNVDFREGIDDEKNGFSSPFDGRKLCKGRMHWPVKKNQEMDESFTSVTSLSFRADDEDDRTSTLSLYCCTLESPPEREEDPRVIKVGEIITDFTGISLADAECRWNSTLRRNIYKYAYTVEVVFRSTAGTLQFRSKAYGSEKGKTFIKFNRD